MDNIKTFDKINVVNSDNIAKDIQEKIKDDFDTASCIKNFKICKLTR